MTKLVLDQVQCTARRDAKCEMENTAWLTRKALQPSATCVPGNEYKHTHKRNPIRNDTELIGRIH